MLRITFSPMSRRASRVAEPRCGSSTTLGWLSSPGFIRGLVLEDVQADPGDGLLAHQRSARAASSMSSPRAVLTRMAWGCSSVSRSADSR